jgi:putative MATE family efflux protein
MEIRMKNDNSGKQFDKMTKTPVHRLVLSLAVPTVISMLVTSFYNMADTYFVSSLGTSASGATGVVFGLMAILQAFGFMFGHGAGSCISRRLGSKDIHSARRYSATSFYLALAAGLIILVFGMTFHVPLMHLLGSTDSILPYAMTYSTYILIAAPAMTTSCVMNNILRYEGRATFSMIGLTSGGILNIIGDYILIKRLGMGIAGAGLSTAISQYISVAILIMPFILGKVQSSLNPRYITLRPSTLCEIITVGMPSMMRQGLNSVSVMVLNQCASNYGDAAIAAMSITTRIIFFMFCVSVGIGQGFQPVSAFNYGAGKYGRVREACRFTCICSMLLMTVAAVAGISLAPHLIQIFRDDPEVIAIGTVALRLQCISLVLMPISLAGNMLFQSIGKGVTGTILASIRSGLVFIPLVIIFSRTMGLLGIQLAQPVSDLVASVVTIPFITHFFRTLPSEEA